MKFKPFVEGNESGRFLVNPGWLEHLLNLFFQGYIGEVWCEVQDTLMNHTKTIENTAYGIVAQEFDKKHLDKNQLNKTSKITNRRLKNG